jgi:hypothetical protein
MTVLVATSVVRGSHQGESHGGVYLIDLKAQRVAQAIDWNTAHIDWQGRGWDRGLRGIAFDGERIFIAASDELFVYTPAFELIDSYRCAYLKHCHEIAVFKRRLFLTSTGFDSILGFDLDNNRFSFGLQVRREPDGFGGTPFDPEAPNGPAPGNTLHLNSGANSSSGRACPMASTTPCRTGMACCLTTPKLMRSASSRPQANAHSTCLAMRRASSPTPIWMTRALPARPSGGASA